MGYCGHFRWLRLPTSCDRNKAVTLLRMLRLTNLNSPRRKAFSALLVLVAVCSLAVSVATRYSSPAYSSTSKTSVLQKQSSSEPGRQRLTKSVANWLPAVVQHATLQSPASYQPLSPAEPPVISSFLDKSLCNRPPPSSDFLS